MRSSLPKCDVAIFLAVHKLRMNGIMQNDRCKIADRCCALINSTWLTITRPTQITVSLNNLFDTLSLHS